MEDGIIWQTMEILLLYGTITVVIIDALHIVALVFMIDVYLHWYRRSDIDHRVIRVNGNVPMDKIRSLPLLPRSKNPNLVADLDRIDPDSFRKSFVRMFEHCCCSFPHSDRSFRTRHHECDRENSFQPEMILEGSCATLYIDCLHQDSF